MLFFLIVCLAGRSESGSNKGYRVVNRLKCRFVTGVHTSTFVILYF